MKRIIALFALLTLAAFIGCQTDQTTTPATPPSYTVTLTLGDSTVLGAVGRQVVVPVTALVTTENSAPAAGVEVSFRLLTGQGSFSDSTVASDQQGIAVSNLRLTVEQGEHTLSLVATTSGGSATGSLTTKGSSTPVYIQVTGETSADAATGQAVPLHLGCIITDANRVGVSGVPVRWRLGTPDSLHLFGSIGQDADGGATFNSLGGFGKEYVVVETDTAQWQGSFLSDSTQIEIRRIRSAIASLTLRAEPSVLNLPPDSIGISHIYATVKDSNGVGIPNVQVDFSTDLGAIGLAVTPTDSTGVATAIFLSNFEIGTATITASIPGIQGQASATVQVRRLGGLHPTMRLNSDLGYVYDDGISAAHIRVILRDQDNVALVGIPVLFRAGFGTITDTTVTDTIGMGRAVFTCFGMPPLDEHGQATVWIWASCPTLGLSDSITITVRPPNPVDHITLNADKSQVLVASADSVALDATCFLLSGDFAPAGTTVQFFMNPQNGRLTNEVVSVTNYGHAETAYLPGQNLGQVTIWAEVRNETGGEDSVARSNEVVITLLPGPPGHITLTANPPELSPDGGPCTVTATILDYLDKPVTQGTLVRFSADNGDQLPTALTDSSGRAIARLIFGALTHDVTVTATAGDVHASIVIPVRGRGPHRIEINVDPMELEPPGSGGDTAATITVTVYDSNDNLYEPPVTVVFQLLNEPLPPLGPQFGNGSKIDSVVTEHGRGHIIMYAGDQIGGILLRFYTWRDPDTRQDTVSAIYSVIAVVAGPPASIDIDVNDEGTDAQGGTWKIAVSARVSDVWHNPVADRIPVVFTVEPDDIATIDPGYTGNDIGGGATRGLAYGYLFYNSVNTGQPITIHATVQGRNGPIEATRPHVLPLQQGNLRLQADPEGPIVWNRARPNDTVSIRLETILTDGHQILIHGMPILFRADRGHLIIDPEHPETAYLRGVMNDFFLDDFTNEVTVHIEAAVEGYDVAANGFILMTRH